MVRLGILGYGNLAKGVECAIRQNPDMALVAVFTRRPPESVKILTPNVPVMPVSQARRWKDQIDVLLLCGGSAKDLPQLTPEFARDFNVIDSFDNHGQIPEHFARVDAVAKQNEHISLISAGWDPGMFSLNRLYATAILPRGQTYTFWGKGISQGHSDAVRRIPGVADCRQYTIPAARALEQVRSGQSPALTIREKHTRYCYVVPEEGADIGKIEQQIKSMPNYFADYDTTVEFISQEQLDAEHSEFPHGGSVIRSGTTGWDNENRQTVEYRLALDSNPQFTASVLVACARAVQKMRQRGITGCQTLFDIPPADLSSLSREEMLAHML